MGRNWSHGMLSCFLVQHKHSASKSHLRPRMESAEDSACSIYSTLHLILCFLFTTTLHHQSSFFTPSYYSSSFSLSFVLGFEVVVGIITIIIIITMANPPEPMPKVSIDPLPPAADSPPSPPPASPPPERKNPIPNVYLFTSLISRQTSSSPVMKAPLLRFQQQNQHSKML
jgi:hypothetical protein